MVGDSGRVFFVLGKREDKEIDSRWFGFCLFCCIFLRIFSGYLLSVYFVLSGYFVLSVYFVLSIMLGFGDI